MKKIIAGLLVLAAGSASAQVVHDLDQLKAAAPANAEIAVPAVPVAKEVSQPTLEVNISGPDADRVPSSKIYSQCTVWNQQGYGSVIQVGNGTYRYSGTVTYVFFNAGGRHLGNATSNVSIQLNGDDTADIGSVRAPSQATSCIVEIGSGGSSPTFPGGIVLGTEKWECRMENGIADAWFYQSVSSFGIDVLLKPGISFFYYDKNNKQIASSSIPTQQTYLPFGWSLITRDHVPAEIAATSCLLGFKWEFIVSKP